MAERCVEAVLKDEVPVGSILALTFTEKAAGELRDRVRRRFLALGEEEHAREVDAGWIGTIHGFCARVLRSRPLAAGLDPRFEVLDEGAAERLARDAYDRAFEDWAAARGAAAVDVAAAFGAGLRDLVLAAHSTLRSRGQTRPVLPIPPPAPDPDPAELAAARAEAARCLATAASVAVRGPRPSNGKKLEEALDALESCDRALGERRCAGAGRARARRAQEGLEGARAGAVRRVPRRLERLPPGLRRPPRAARAGRDRRPADPLRRGLRRGQGRPRRPRLRGPRARRPRPARRRPRRSRALGRALPPDHGRRVPGHEPAAARHPRGARARQPVRGRRRVPVDLRLPPRRRDDLPRAAGRAGGGADPAADRQLPLPRGAARRPQRRLRPPVGGALRAAPRRRHRERQRRAAAVRPRRAGRHRAARRAAGHRLARLGGRRPPRPHRRRGQAPPPRRGPRHRPPPPPRARGRPRRARHRGARPRDRLPAPVRGGARGAGRADLRRRRPRLLVPAAGPRRPRLPRRARQPARRGSAPRHARLPVLRRRLGRPDPALPGRGGVGHAARRGPARAPRR